MIDHDPHAYPERVLISYSHDSPEHVERVRALAARLRGEGVFVVLDQYDPHPPEGWPQWMRRQIDAATHVLIVCTETYLHRVNLRESPGRGLGATWEGNLVILAAYAGQGYNEKFIPVVFSAADHDFVPDFLQGVTRYDLSADEGYEQLYARLTDQQIVPVPPIGQRRTVAQAAREEAHGRVRSDDETRSHLVPDLMLIEAHGRTLFVPVERTEEQGSRVEFTIVSRDAEDAAFLGGLRGGWSQTRVWVAYGDTAVEGSVEAADRSRDASGERWRVVLAVDEQNRGAITEMATSGKSADDIAELRARRILLDERPPAEVARWGRTDTMLETLVQGLGSRGRSLAESPIPALYRQLGKDEPLFLAAARLMAVLELKRTETVEHVLELTLRMSDPHHLHVRFRGRRREFYTNMPAHEMTFEGVCPLD
jgi:hypothetical protein